MTTGRCLCGNVRYSFEGEASAVLHCYCESCRRATSSPVTTFLTVARNAINFTGEELGVYASSPGVERYFCRTCGSPMGYANAKVPHEFDLYAASLDNPSAVMPDFHVYHSERLPWIKLDDALPRHDNGTL